MEPRNVSPLWACGCVRVFARESSTCECVGARVRPCECSARAKRSGRGRRIGTQVGSGGPACTRKEETSGPRGYGRRERDAFEEKVGPPFAPPPAMPCRRGKMGTIIRHQGSTPFAPLRSIRTIYTWVYQSLPSPSFLYVYLLPSSPVVFDHISVTAVSF